MTSRRDPFTLRAAIQRQLVLVVALPLAFLIIVFGAFGFAAEAGIALAVLLGALAVLRAVLPIGWVGALAVRTRAVDVAVLTTFAVALVLLALSAPNL
ncbi:DUF3017 domain-containing protein [Devriesea agamarum]|uniref:DUF3017 domain-containing protein n=1 Tax=Devriesea agamarum TaxID=472569 RepID=UPI00071D4725|nr:DUF3017 domain-containing protein [Devriesea agamarum]